MHYYHIAVKTSDIRGYEFHETFASPYRRGCPEGTEDVLLSLLKLP